MSNKLSEKYKNRDGRKDNINRKELLEDYIEENKDKLLCVHNIDHYAGLPMKLLGIRGALEQLENEGIIKCVNRETCTFSQHTPHKQYMFVPEDERKMKYKGKDELLEIIKDEIGLGKEWFSKRITHKFREKNRSKVHNALSTLEREGILVSEKPEDSKWRIYQLLDYGSKKYDTGMESVLDRIKERYDEEEKFVSSDFLDIYPTDRTRRNASATLYRLMQKGVLKKAGKEKCGQNGRIKNVYQLVGKGEETEVEEKEEVEEERDFYKNIREMYKKERSKGELQELDTEKVSKAEKISKMLKELKRRRLKKVMLLALHDAKRDEMTSKEVELWESIREAIGEYGI